MSRLADRIIAMTDAEYDSWVQEQKIAAYDFVVAWNTSEDAAERRAAQAHIQSVKTLLNGAELIRHEAYGGLIRSKPNTAATKRAQAAESAPERIVRLPYVD